MTISPRLAGRIGLGVLSALFVLTGCSSIGPGTVQRDRFDYAQTVSESWKRQVLLNIVKLRYVDPPVQLEVGQIVSGYSLETDVSLGGTLSAQNDHSLSLGASGRYTDRPTITYTPLTGPRYLRSAMMPLPPDAVFFLIQAGWPADGVLFTALASVNGLKNQQATLAGVTPADPRFMRVLELLRQIQISGGVALRIEQDPKKQETIILAFQSKDIAPQTLRDLAELRGLLKLNPDTHEFHLLFAATPANDGEIAVITRSPLHIMAMMSAYVEVPPEDIADGRATPGLPVIGAMRIKSARKRPTDAFASVGYHGDWFWVDDRDLKTKRAFGLLMMLSTLSDPGPREPLPLITIPAQ